MRVGGDIVTKIEQDVIEDSNDLAEAVSKHRPGDTVTFEYYRGKDRRTAKVKLGERPLVVARPRSRP